MSHLAGEPLWLGGGQVPRGESLAFQACHCPWNFSYAGYSESSQTGVQISSGAFSRTPPQPCKVAAPPGAEVGPAAPCSRAERGSCVPQVPRQVRATSSANTNHLSLGRLKGLPATGVPASRKCVWGVPGSVCVCSGVHACGVCVCSCARGGWAWRQRVTQTTEQVGQAWRERPGCLSRFCSSGIPTGSAGRGGLAADCPL